MLLQKSVFHGVLLRTLLNFQNEHILSKIQPTLISGILYGPRDSQRCICISRVQTTNNIYWHNNWINSLAIIYYRRMSSRQLCLTGTSRIEQTVKWLVIWTDCVRATSSHLSREHRYYIKESYIPWPRSLHTIGRTRPLQARAYRSLHWQCLVGEKRRRWLHPSLFMSSHGTQRETSLPFRSVFNVPFSFSPGCTAKVEQVWQCSACVRLTHVWILRWSVIYGSPKPCGTGSGPKTKFHAGWIAL